MRRALAVAAVGVCVLCLSAALAQIAPPPAGFAVGPYLQHVTPTGITIMWETLQRGTSEVHYGLAAPFTQQAKAPGQSRIHEVTLTGLQPGAGYFYRVRSVTEDGTVVESPVYSFKTAVGPDTPFCYVVMGDSRTYPERWAKVCEQAWAERPDLALHVGDVVSDGNVETQWRTEWLLPAAVLMQRVPMYVAIGNHERNAHWFYDYVSYPKPENYYSFDYGNAHFAVVDSCQDVAPGSPQYQWLEQDLKASHARWKFVAHHHPQYSSDLDDYGDSTAGPSTLGEERMRPLARLYEKYGVDIVWVGHIHDYERTYPLRGGKAVRRGGVVYIQAGGGGAELEDFAPIRSPFTAKVFRGWQFCTVTINGGELRMTATDIEGRLFDWLELRK